LGTLHAHSNVSDGAAPPADAYAWAKNNAKVDFLSLTEHNHECDNAGMDQVATASTAATTRELRGSRRYRVLHAAPQGREPHQRLRCARNDPRGDNNNYLKLFHDWLPHTPSVTRTPSWSASFNHPNKSVDHEFGISKIGSFPNYSGTGISFLADADRWVRLIAIINGPA